MFELEGKTVALDHELKEEIERSNKIKEKEIENITKSIELLAASLDNQGNDKIEPEKPTLK